MHVVTYPFISFYSIRIACLVGTFLLFQNLFTIQQVRFCMNEFVYHYLQYAHHYYLLLCVIIGVIFLSIKFQVSIFFFPQREL